MLTLFQQQGLLGRRRRTLLLVLAPVCRLACGVAVLGLLAARAALHLGQNRAAVKANTAIRLVRWPVLQLALSVAVPRTNARTCVDRL